MKRGASKHLLGLLILCSFSLLVSSEVRGGQIQQPSIKEVNWDRVKDNLDTFFDLPCSKNAKMVLDSMPVGEVSIEKGDLSGMMELARQKYTIIKTEVLSGNRDAAELLFRLLAFADGADASDIQETMGLLIRVNPRLFLDMLFNYHKSPMFRDGYPVTTLAPAYWDSKGAQRYELEMRIIALESVGGSKYSEIIRNSVQQLRTMIFKISL